MVATLKLRNYISASWAGSSHGPASDWIIWSVFMHRILSAAQCGHFECFYTHRLLHTHTRTRFCTQTLLHTGAFTHRHFCTQTLLHKPFKRRDCYTQTLLHTDTFTHRRFTQRGFYAQTFYTKRLLRTDVLHKEAFTCRPFYT